MDLGVLCTITTGLHQGGFQFLDFQNLDSSTEDFMKEVLNSILFKVLMKAVLTSFILLSMVFDFSLDPLLFIIYNNHILPKIKFNFRKLGFWGFGEIGRAHV